MRKLPLPFSLLAGGRFRLPWDSVMVNKDARPLKCVSCVRSTGSRHYAKFAMQRATSNHVIAASRAPSRLRTFFATVTALAILPIAGCSGANANAPAVLASAEASATAMSSNPQVEQTLENSCFDCHSNHAPGPWNAKLAPSYLFGTANARKSLDFSDWQSYDASRKSTEMAAITRVIENGSMPPWDYDFFHPSARLNGEQRQDLLQWAARQPAPAKP
jgi:hypothetical protein